MNINYWKSSEKVEREILAYEHLNDLKSLFKFCLFWRGCILPSDYVPSPEWDNIIELSDHCNNLLENELMEFKDTDKSILNFCLFRIFYYHELLITPESINIESIIRILEKETIENKILFPFYFGRTLYDKYNALFADYIENRLDCLYGEDVIKLLENTPAGVFQLGSSIIGPLGVLESNENRYFSPVVNLPLWHCSDIGCRAPHTVDLIIESPVSILEKKIKARLSKNFGSPSEWRGTFTRISLHTLPRKLNFNYYDMVSILGDSFIEREIKLIFLEALKTHFSTTIRKNLGQTNKKDLSHLSPESIVDKLQISDIIQLLLCLDDSDLIKIIEHCIDIKLIKIPIGQIRYARKSPYIPGYTKAFIPETYLSCYGFCSTKNDASISLLTMIEKAYQYNDNLRDLKWKLKLNDGSSIGSALFDYLEKYGPEYVVHNLILPSEDVCDYFSSKLSISINPLADTSTFVNRLLYRFGYVPIFRDTIMTRLDEAIMCFLNVLDDINVDDNVNKERVRSVGVNLFIAVEEFLDSFVTYNTWVLSSDHFVNTRLTYNLDKARKSVTTLLGATLYTEQQELKWDEGGGNTFSVLLRYLSELKKWIIKLPDRNRDDLKRNESDLPFYSQHAEIPFLYKHTQLWADLDINSIKQYINDFSNICDNIDRANICFIRNGIDHMRSDEKFPKVDDMRNCAYYLKIAADLACNKRYFPNPLWLNKEEISRKDIFKYTFIDSNNNSFTILGPFMFKETLIPNTTSPFLVAPIRVNEYTNTDIIFGFEQRNEYDSYWDGYPG